MMPAVSLSSILLTTITDVESKCLCQVCIEAVKVNTREVDEVSAEQSILNNVFIQIIIQSKYC